VVVVLGQKPTSTGIPRVNHSFTVLYIQKMLTAWLGKVLGGAIYAAEKPAKMSSERNDSHGH
jgi:hypothetical protein